MTVATMNVGGAAGSELELRRARVRLADSAEALAAVCRDTRASPDVVAAAEASVSAAFAHYGGLMLVAASLRQQ